MSVPAGSTTHDLFLDAAARYPDHVAVEQDGVVVTYAELERRSGWIADHVRRAMTGTSASGDSQNGTPRGR